MHVNERAARPNRKKVTDRAAAAAGQATSCTVYARRPVARQQRVERRHGTCASVPRALWRAPHRGGAWAVAPWTRVLRPWRTCPVALASTPACLPECTCTHARLLPRLYTHTYDDDVLLVLIDHALHTYVHARNGRLASYRLNA